MKNNVASLIAAIHTSALVDSLGLQVHVHHLVCPAQLRRCLLTTVTRCLCLLTTLVMCLCLPTTVTNCLLTTATDWLLATDWLFSPLCPYQLLGLVPDEGRGRLIIVIVMGMATTVIAIIIIAISLITIVLIAMSLIVISLIAPLVVLEALQVYQHLSDQRTPLLLALLSRIGTAVFLVAHYEFLEGLPHRLLHVVVHLQRTLLVIHPQHILLVYTVIMLVIIVVVVTAAVAVTGRVLRPCPAPMVELEAVLLLSLEDAVYQVGLVLLIPGGLVLLIPGGLVLSRVTIMSMLLMVLMVLMRQLTVVLTEQHLFVVVAVTVAVPPLQVITVTVMCSTAEAEGCPVDLGPPVTALDQIVGFAGITITITNIGIALGLAAFHLHPLIGKHLV